MALVAGSIGQAAAQPVEQSYALEAQDLSAALTEVARISGAEIVAPADILVGLATRRLFGTMTAAAAIDRLLAGTGLHAERLNGAFIIKRDIGRDGRTAEDDGLITVTGSRIRGSGPVGSSITTIDRDTIEKSGYATTQQLLQSIPQNFGGGQNEATLGAGIRNNAGTNAGYGSGINLRGLGSSSTLVLFDGNRPPLGGLSGVFADLSLVPSSAIERIEILADGASAIYGSDAVAGVVNILFRDRFEGAETRLRFGVADGFNEVQASQLLGAGWRNGHATLAYEYYGRGRLEGDMRAFWTEDLTRFGGPDYRTSYASPGTIIAANGAVFGIPDGQDGSALDPADLIPGQVNRFDTRRAADILPRQRTHSLHGALRQELTDTLSLKASGLFARRRYHKATLPEQLVATTVPVANPFYVDPIGTGQPVRVQYRFAGDLGIETDRGTVTGFTATLGIEKRLNGWQLDLDGSFGRQREFRENLNLPNRFRLADALADTDPATAYNVFGAGTATNPATIESIRGGRESWTRHQVWTAAARANGPLFALPAGTVRLAAGGEYRVERYSARTLTDITTEAPVARTNTDLPSPRDVIAGYAELFVPVFGPDARLPGFQRLEASLAGRIERYSDVGTTANPRFGLRWVPVGGITLRGTYGTSFRAPSFAELVGPKVGLFLPTLVPDPASPDGQTVALALFGYAPDIQPEKATTWTIGADIAPNALPELRLSITYFDIDYRDRIDTASADTFRFLQRRDLFGGLVTDNPSASELATFYDAPVLSNPSNIPASAIEVILDGRIRNLSAVRQNGIDLDLRFSPAFAGGRLDLGLSGSYILAVKRRLTEAAPASDVVDTLGNPVDLRLRARAGWSGDGFDLAAFVNYIDGYDNLIPLVPERVDAWTTVDVHLGYTLATGGLLAGTRLALNISNLLDAPPPYVHNRTVTSALGYDPDNASAIGRLVAVQVIKKW